MEDPRRRSTLSFSFILCFSLWLTPGESSGDQSTYECPANYFTSNYNVLCKDRCEKRGYDYYWCHSFQKSSGYCSPGEKRSYKGNTCSNACGKYGESFYVCYLGGDTWEKCGRVEPRAMIYYTRYGKECVDSCEYYESGDYFWCHYEGGWDYCSPLPDHDDKNEPCRPDHKCDNHGESYTWCYTTNNNDWQYCGVIKPGECQFSLTSLAKRQPNNQRVTCTRKDKNDKRVTIFREEDLTRKFAVTNRKLRNEALDLINQWDNQRLSDLPRSELITSRNLRLDNQGLITRNNQPCYNLQIHTALRRAPHLCTTVAAIIVPVDTSAEYMRLAFRESLKAEVSVVVEVNVESNPTNNNQKSCTVREN